MKISAKQAREVLDVSNKHWAHSMEKHGEGDVDLEAFTHMIVFRLSSAIHDMVAANLSSVIAEGIEDATPEEYFIDNEVRVVH